MATPWLDDVCAAVRDLFDARACACAVVRDERIDGTDPELEFVAGSGEGVARLLGSRLRVGEGIAGYVAEAGVPVEVHDVPLDERFAAHLRVHREYVPASLLGAPLLGPGGRVLGVINVLDPSGDVVREVSDEVGGALPVLQLVASEVAELLAGQEAPDSVYAGPPPATLASADSILRAVKSAQRSRASATVQNAASLISRS